MMATVRTLKHRYTSTGLHDAISQKLSCQAEFMLLRRVSFELRINTFEIGVDAKFAKNRCMGISVKRRV
jgi:hypothetical protein